MEAFITLSKVLSTSVGWMLQSRRRLNYKLLDSHSCLKDQVLVEIFVF